MGFLQLQDIGTVHFHEYGSGSRPLLAFHGYGMTGKQFHVLEQTILKGYYVHGFDHFFHGQSQLNGWSEKQIMAGMSKDMVRLYMEAWFAQYGRQRFSVMGYSIGANLALIIVEEYAHLIDDVILMAPDGLSVYKGFHFLMHNNMGRFFFRWATKSKWLAPTMLKTVKRLGMIDQSLYTIAYNEIDTPKKRQDVYYTLNLIKQLQPDTGKLVQIINEREIKCLFVFGKEDLLFPKSAAMPFISGLNNAEVHEVPMGHWLVTPKLDEYLLNCTL